ncbi:hypothetical protein KSP40_PGU021646 [Platanthera guangdongensis]|uniref:Uncharacterized protein n=1 Tax=Platanthera guangdongensis TaxID=2320717 RepID=A0ABR2MCA0_9ASPA
MQNRGFSLASECLCCNKIKDLDNLLLKSSIAEAIWRFYAHLFDIKFTPFLNIHECLSIWRNSKAWVNKKC